MAYFSSKKGEIQELATKLNDSKIDVKRDAMRKIIMDMTSGKDLSSVFPDVIKNMENSNMELKKLIYLFVINYSRTHPDLALLAINSFRKDSLDEKNPLLRALAVRTMGSLRVKEIVEHLVDTLKDSLKDQDSYVRKTACICIAKLYDSNPELMEEQGFLDFLQSLLTDGNAMVVSNAVACLTLIADRKGFKLLNINSQIASRLLTALNECTEWGQIYILDALSDYVPQEQKEIEQILDRISSRLSHINAAVVLSTVKVIMRYMDYLTNPESIRKYSQKLADPLVTLSSNESEIQYIILKNINLIIQKRPNILEKEVKLFFCNFNDPIYIKLEKLEILVKLADYKNLDMLLHELKEYTTEVDIEFVRRSVRIIGRLAIKLDNAADRCVQALWDCIKQSVKFVIQEAIIVVRDIFRKYPKRYQGILVDLCKDIKSFDDPEARAAIIWIIGENVDIVSNASDLLGMFMDGIRDDTEAVQNQLLTAVIKLYLARNEDGEMLQQLLKILTEECDNPDIRDRAYIYWRMIVTDMNITRDIIFSQKPLISDQSYTLETTMLEKLIENLGTLSSVYGKSPQTFVKILRESQNQKEIEERENLEAEDAIPEEDMFDSTGQRLGQSQPATQTYGYDYSQKIPNQYPNKDNLGSDAGSGQVIGNQGYGSNIDLLDTQEPNEFNKNKSIQCKNIKIPYSQVLNEKDVSIKDKISGLAINAVVQLEGTTPYLYLQILNKMKIPITNFTIFINKNTFKICPNPNDRLSLIGLNPGDHGEGKISLLFNGEPSGQLPECPYQIQVAFSSNVDAFVFMVPVAFTVLLACQQNALNQMQYSQLQQRPNQTILQNSVPCNLNVQQIKEKFVNNNIRYVYSRQVQNGIEILSFECKTINDMEMGIDCYIAGDQLMLNLQTPHPSLQPLLLQAINFILKLQ